MQDEHLEDITYFICATCGRKNIVEVDITAGYQQEYTEDCQVCCRPNYLTVTFDKSTLLPSISTTFEE